MYLAIPGKISPTSSIWYDQLGHEIMSIAFFGENIAVTTDGRVYVKVSESWVLADPYVKVNGVWTRAYSYVKNAGVWSISQ